MTSPGGSSGFETGPDFVAARLSIDVPTEGITNLRELSQQIDRFRTSTESAARGSENFVKYLQQIIQAGTQATEVHRNLAAAMERTVDMQSRATAGGSSAMPLSSNTIAGGEWGGAGTAGMGSGSGGSRPTTATDVNSQIINPNLQRDPQNDSRSIDHRV